MNATTKTAPVSKNAKTVAKSRKVAKTEVSRVELFQALRDAAVPDPDLLSIPLDVDNAKLMQQLDDVNRPKNVPHCGTMGRSMRNWKDKTASDRWVERANAMALSDKHKLDGGHRDMSAVLAFGDEDDWKWACLRFYTLDPSCKLMKAVKGDDGKERMVPDVERLVGMVSESPSRPFRPNPKRWATKDCPRIIVSLNVDPHYFQVADSTINERSGADMLATHPTIANELAGVGLSAKSAEVIMRSAYLAMYQSWVIKPKAKIEEARQNASYGSMKKGGNIGPDRFRGMYLTIFRKALIGAKRIYDTACKEQGSMFDLGTIRKYGENNVLLALTLLMMGDSKYTPCNAQEQEDWLSAEEWGYRTYDRDVAIAAIRELGSTRLPTDGKPTRNDAQHLLAECSRDRKRIHVAERVRALLHILSDGATDCTFPEWAGVCVAALHDVTIVDDKGESTPIPNVEQEPGYRAFGPDSTGLPKRLIVASKKLNTDV